jgi:Ni/Co efflux regulator RcnB
MVRSKLALPVALTLMMIGAAAVADPQHEEHGGPAPHGESHGPQGHGPGGHPPGEPHPGPSGYQRLNEPHGWNSRPPVVNRDAYRHNFQAARSFRIGPYHRPSGWAPHHWAFGQTLPRAYWGPSYLIADYWLFALEVPPAGYEWVRDDSDALLVSTDTGEILQVEYGVFG